MSRFFRLSEGPEAVLRQSRATSVLLMIGAAAVLHSVRPLRLGTIVYSVAGDPRITA